MTDNAKIYDRVRQEWIDVIPDGLQGFGDISSQTFLGRDTTGIGAVEVLDMPTARRMLGINDLAAQVNELALSVNNQAANNNDDCCCCETVNNIGLNRGLRFL